MIYQVYYESISIQNPPIKWYAGVPIEYSYGNKVLYPEPVEEYKTLKQAVERAEYLSCVTHLTDPCYKYTNVKVSKVNSKGKIIVTIPFRNHKNCRDVKKIIGKF